MASTPPPYAAADSTDAEPQMLQVQQQSPSAEEQKEIAPFLRSLRRMLDRESDAILCWTADGRAFEIHDMDVMTSYILPKYFKHAKYTSFQRQLNYFNFRKWTKSRAVVCTFSNAFFVRDQPDLTWRITRKRGLSDAKSVGADGLSDSGEASPRTPKSPKPRAASKTSVSSSSSASSSAAAATKPAPLKRENSAGTKRKATSSSSAPATSNKRAAKMSSAKASIVKIESSAAAGESAGATDVPTDVAESLEWVDTLYPSLEALEAECSVSAASLHSSTATSQQYSSSYSSSSYSHPSDQVAYAWPQYPGAQSAAVDPADCFGLQTPSYESYFVPTVVQTQCLAL